MPKAPWIIILGAGFGGLSVAKKLDEYLEEHPNTMQVVLVDRNHSMTIGKANQFVLAGRSTPMQVTSSYLDLNFRNVYFVQDEIVEINTTTRTVFGRGHRFKYEKLVVALGAVSDLTRVHGLNKAAYNMSNIDEVMQLKDALADIRRGNIIIAQSQTPCVGPTSPYEYAFLIKNILEKNQAQQPNILENTSITITTPDSAPYPQQSPDVMERLLDEAEIEFVPNFTPHLVDSKKRTIYYKNGEKKKYDILVAHYPHKAPEVLWDAGLVDEKTGFVPADQLTLRTQVQNVYCLGDCADFPIPGTDIPHPKAGVFAAKQALTVAKDIIIGIEDDSKVPWDWQEGEQQDYKEAIAVQLPEVGHNLAIRITSDFYSEDDLPIEELYTVTEPDQEHMRSLIAWWDELITAWFTQ